MAQIYLSLWIRIPGADYEDQSFGSKFFYIGVGEPKTSAGNQLYTVLHHPDCCAVQTIASAFPLLMEQQSVPAGNNTVTANVNNALFTIGVWHQFEFVLKLNTVGQGDGWF